MILAENFTILLSSFRGVIIDNIFETSDISSFSDLVVVTLILLSIRFASDFVSSSATPVISVSETIISYDIRIISDKTSECEAADNSLSNIFIRGDLSSRNTSFKRTALT